MNHSNLIQKYNCYLFAIVALAFLQGCVSVPTHAKEKPFNEDQIVLTETNNVTKDDVLRRLGQPSVVRNDGALFLYHTEAKVGVQIDARAYLFYSAFALAAYTYSGGLLDITDLPEQAEIVIDNKMKSYYLIVEFDADDNVMAAEALSGSKPGELSGYSIEENYIYEQRRKTRKLILYDTPEEDAAAKRFELPVEGAVIYAYLDKSLASNGYVSIDRQSEEYANGDGFFRWEVDPGNHRVGAQRDMYRGTIEKSLNLRCKAGQTYFIRLKPTSPKLYDDMALEVSVVDNKEGRREISKRKLILL